MDLHHRPVSWFLPALLAACAPASTTDQPLHTDQDSDAVVPADPTAPNAGPPLEIEVGRPLTLRGRRNIAQARWDLGDGSKAQGATVTHTYATPGNYVATYTITTAGGITLSDTTRITAYLPAAATPPVASSALLVDDTHGTVYAAVPEANHIAAVRVDGAVYEPIPVCDTPRNIALTDTLVVVTCEHSDQLAMFRRDTRAFVGRINLPVGTRPFGIVGRGSSVWVAANGTGSWLEVDVVSKAVVSTNTERPDPRAMVLAPDGSVWGTRFRAVFDDTDGGTGRGEVFHDTSTIALTADPGPDSDVAQRGLPNLLQGLVMSPDGGTLYVGGLLSNTLGGIYRDGAPFRFDTTVHATLRTVDTATGLEDFDARKQFDNQDSVRALALSPRGNWLWVAHQGTQTISRMDAYTLRASGVILQAGQGIDALAASPDGTRLYVHAWLDREIRVYDIADPSVPSPTLLWRAPTVSTEPLASDELIGKRLFYNSADRRIARDGYQHCAVCHPDGRQDGMVWDFTQRGEGLRNTISLEGRAGIGMGAMHWSGNFDEVQDFENDIRLHQGGLGLLSDDDWSTLEPTLGEPKAGRSPDLDALSAYVTSLGVLPTSPTAEPDGGAQAFADAGCTACHIPPLYTDSGTDVRHDIGTIKASSGQRLGGTLDGIDTPTLLGAFATPPYLHDGSAPTVQAAIEAHATPGDPLSPETLALLADFVRSL